MTTAAVTYWKILNPKIVALCDPRVKVARHLEWRDTNVKASTWAGVEPDNYNFAIFDQRPHDLAFVENQVFYKIDETYSCHRIRGWMSLYYITDANLHQEFYKSVNEIQPGAYWYYPRSRSLRTKQSIYDRENNYKRKSDVNFTTEERLWQLGYFEKLQRKYFDGDERFIKVLGTPRSAVQNYLPEVSDYEVEDF